MDDRLKAGEALSAESTAAVDASPTLDIEELIRQYHGDMYRYAYRLSGSVPDAEDLTQQAFLIAQRKLHQLRDASKARGWLYTVVRSCFLKACRKNKPLTATVAELSVDQIPEDREVEDEIDGQQLQAAIETLPDEFKLVVLMFYFEDFSYKQIAAELDIPVGTVMSRLARAKGRLRRALIQFNGDAHRLGIPTPTSSAGAVASQTSERQASR